MSSDDPESTVIDDEVLVRRRPASKQPVVAWVLFAATALFAAIIAIVLAKKVGQEADRANQEMTLRSTAEATAKANEDLLTSEKSKVEGLQGQVTKLTQERDALSAQLAKAKETPAPAAKPAKKVTPPKKVSPVKKRRR